MVAIEYAEMFNEAAIGASLKKLGLTYTSELKGELSTKLRSITDVEFLKRKFRFDPETLMWEAPLRLSVVKEIPYWTKRIEGMEETIVKDNVQNAIYELALHGPDVFQIYTKPILRACKNIMNWVPEHTTFTVCRNFIRNREEFY
jgi:hypothetical protein